MAGAADEQSSFSLSNGLMAANGTTHFNGTSEGLLELLDIIHFHYAWFLGLVFLVAFFANSILSAERLAAAKETVLLGPGGKPLPGSARKSREERERKKLLDFTPGRKQVFLCLSIGLLGTFVASGTNIVLHALYAKETVWWCGEPTAVS